MKKIIVIGAGLAGSEASLYLANKGFQVDLYEMRPSVETGAHKTSDLAEFVCSNSLGGTSLTSATGLLKEEMKRLGGSLINIAFKNAVPSGNSLSIDRFGFSNEVTKLIEENKNINLIRKEITEIDTNLPTIIATGPLTSPKMCEYIKKITNEENFHFFDAIAPIVEKESINFEKAFYASRWQKGDADFINCPMNKEEYDNFYNILTTAEKIELKSFEAKYFEGCLPVEVLASRGIDTLRFGPMKPVGLRDERKPDEKFHAVVQLRQDDKMGNLYNLVGFQTNLKWGEQKRLIESIPGLENAKIVRYGVMHANSFINSPKILNATLQTKEYENVFFAGQITGVEGYNESIATGLLAGINMARYLNNKELIELPDTTMLGALTQYITFKEHKHFQPVNSNWGIVREIELDRKIKKNKELKNTHLANRALDDLKKFQES
ncbi:MAG: methylenetetrahydrofolate--tRNA-(uracil(54)-C(5))-methyltransferase (FADH(2)-oxidizing) TrmFO [Cyanobacteria bacterium SIG30]|nr:methylenetetrahydrofolate--tRNA-(uracil(54)-C(5))-methyltransferase (FADH(2)-oxidizing) TrmFO [Cyanobacteria bacterium SIG30]